MSSSKRAAKDRTAKAGSHVQGTPKTITPSLLTVTDSTVRPARQATARTESAAASASSGLIITPEAVATATNTVMSSATARRIRNKMVASPSIPPAFKTPSLATPAAVARPATHSTIALAGSASTSAGLSTAASAAPATTPTPNVSQVVEDWRVLASTRVANTSEEDEEDQSPLARHGRRHRPAERRESDLAEKPQTLTLAPDPAPDPTPDPTPDAAPDLAPTPTPVPKTQRSTKRQEARDAADRIEANGILHEGESACVNCRGKGRKCYTSDQGGSRKCSICVRQAKPCSLTSQANPTLVEKGKGKASAAASNGPPPVHRQARRQVSSMVEGPEEDKGRAKKRVKLRENESQRGTIVISSRSASPSPGPVRSTQSRTVVGLRSTPVNRRVARAAAPATAATAARKDKKEELVEEELARGEQSPSEVRGFGPSPRQRAASLVPAANRMHRLDPVVLRLQRELTEARAHAREALLQANDSAVAARMARQDATDARNDAGRANAEIAILTRRIDEQDDRLQVLEEELSGLLGLSRR